jgi:hypothetical protein
MALGKIERHADFAIERDQVEFVEFAFVGAIAGALEQVGMMMTQINA